MKPNLIAALVLAAAPAVADGGVTVQLPTLPAMSEGERKGLLAALVQANVVSSNCAGYEISNGEWTLITGTADRLAGELGLDAAAYDDQYYGPSFASLDKPGTCAADGPKVRPLIDTLIGWGGGTNPV